MQTVYWRPRKVSRIQLVSVTALAIVSLVGVELLKVEERQPHYDEKLAAARTARNAGEALKAERLRRQLPIDAESDPAGTGLIGAVISPITSGSGNLAAKQTVANPNLAAVVVEWLKDLNIKAGDIVAVGFSGSFPGANIAVLAALHTLQARPIVISSLAASQWGANHPSFTWLDMEETLVKRGILPYHSVAVSRGGVADRGLGMSKEGRELLDTVMQRSGLVQIRPKTPDESIQQRMALYAQYAGDEPIAAYVNVGGGTVSVGTKIGKRTFHTGINQRLPRAMAEIPSVIGEFLREGIPVIHIVRATDIAQQYGLPMAPTTPPNVGDGGVFTRREHNRWLALVSVLVISAAMWQLFRLPYAARLLTRGSAAPREPLPPPP